HVPVLSAAGQHGRELVIRQGPRHAWRDDKGDASYVLALDVLDEPVERLVQMAVVDGEGVTVAGAGVGSERDDQGVIEKFFAVGGVRHLPGGLHPGECVRYELCVEIARDSVERIALG